MMANDLRLRESQTTLVEILRDAGYHTGLVDRRHLHGGRHEPGFVPPNPSRQGFDFWAAHEWHHQHFLIEGSTKRIVPDPRDVPDAKPKLYDVVRDPWEKTNLAAQPPDRIRALTRRLDAEWTTLVTAK